MLRQFRVIFPCFLHIYTRNPRQADVYFCTQTCNSVHHSRSTRNLVDTGSLGRRFSVHHFAENELLLKQMCWKTFRLRNRRWTTTADRTTAPDPFTFHSWIFCHYSPLTIFLLGEHSPHPFRQLTNDSADILLINTFPTLLKSQMKNF